MTTVKTYHGLESVVMFGGSPAEFSGKWTAPEFPKLTEMLIYNFGTVQCLLICIVASKCILFPTVIVGNHASEWALVEEEKLQKVISPIPECDV